MKKWVLQTGAVPFFILVRQEETENAATSTKKNKRGTMLMGKKRIKGWKIAGGVAAGAAVAVIGILAWFTLREYRPEKEETIPVSKGTKTVAEGDSLTILTYNTGYAGLDKDADFFMDGGKGVQPQSKEKVEENMEGIADILRKNKADIYFLQEVDQDSKRSFHIDQTQYYQDAVGMDGMFARNFKCDFVPYPIPPIGKVESGILTMTDLLAESAMRISLPESFSWPVKTCNLKRCMLETRIPVQGSEKELVVIQFHLEAYDSGEGKEAQSRMLAKKLQEEYEKGNYVIAGGDFNQTFEMIDKYPVQDKENWIPGVIGTEDLPEHFAFAVDDTYPTCRLLNAPYTGSYDTSQVYVLDGFIVSDNLLVEETKTVNLDFRYTDHQPVKLSVRLN